ncbi:hypothetical protein R1sor_000051 [Riccia sorocarpa]|uniref:NmrA-like domain-containing protein n=1 Tax=Riccia sorocarpa TaxID=122646 RepID=A0ABD3GW07_9MARC
MNEDKSKVLIIGATGRQGRHIDKGQRSCMPFTISPHPTTYSENLGAEKAALLGDLKTLGTTILEGSLLIALKEMDVVISAVAHVDQQFLLT